MKTMVGQDRPINAMNDIKGYRGLICTNAFVKTVFCLFISLLLCPALNADLLDIYRQGELKLIDDENWGIETEWDDPSLYKISSIAVSMDGSIFAAVSKQHKIFKFDKDGKVLFQFGQKGQGPSDLFYPGNLSILDNKYLVVCEYASNRRISIFNLNGKFEKIIRTSYPVISAVALNNNKIAILTTFYLKNSRKTSIFIKDIISHKERKIADRIDELRIVNTGNNVLIDRKLQGEGFIRRIMDGNLLIGFSYDRNIKIYSNDGLLIKSFELKTSPIKVDSSVINRYIKSNIENIKKNFKNPQQPLNDFRKASNKVSKLFYDYLPFYNNIIIDDHNYILFSKFSFSYDKFSLEFQVYSPKGEYICNTNINLKNLNCLFKTEDFSNEELVFLNGNIYIIIDTKVMGDEQRKIIKTHFADNLPFKNKKSGGF